jgi:hypothetical protein
MMSNGGQVLKKHQFNHEVNWANILLGIALILLATKYDEALPKLLEGFSYD